MKTYPAFLLTGETARTGHASPTDISVTAASDGKLEISVLFTSLQSTIAAVHRAAALLKGLDGRISLIEAQAIPYPLPLDTPPVALDFTRQRLLTIAAESELEIAVFVYLCRFRLETLSRVLKPGSVIVIGCRRKWWPSWEKKLARRLQRAGYQAIVVEAA